MLDISSFPVDHSPCYHSHGFQSAAASRVVVALIVFNSTTTLVMDHGPELGHVQKCSDEDVPYPFGIGDGKCCSW
jgi:hypothetical protein